MTEPQNDSANILTVEMRLSISADECLRYYRGKAKSVIASSTSGLKVQFPANLLNQHVTHDGVHGKFVLQYLTTGKAVELARISR